MLLKYIRFCISCFGVTACSLIFAGDFDLKNALAHPQNWKFVDWDSPGALRDSGWEQVGTFEKNAKGQILVGKQEAPVFSLPKAKFVRWQDESSRLDVALNVSYELEYEECLKVAPSIGAELGTAVESDETTRAYFSEKHFLEIPKREWQWTVGSTRITSMCFGARGASSDTDGFAVFAVNYESVKTRAKLAPPILLRCSQEYELTNTSIRKVVNDIVFWASLSRPMFRNTRLAIIGDTKSHIMDDLRFVFRVNAKEFSTTYEVDRVTGELRADVMEGDKKVATIRGNCEKESSSKKF